MIDYNDANLVKTALTFWDRLDSVTQEYVLDNTFTTEYKKKEFLNPGDKDCFGIIIVKKGRLRVYMLSDEGKEVTLYRLEAGEVCVLSSNCVLNSLSFEVHLSAEVDSELFHISAHIFQNIVQKNIYAECFFYKLAAERFSSVMWSMEQILFTSFDKRLAAFLIDESINLKTDTLSYTHEEIAHYVGSAREVVSRMLKYFASEGYVTLVRGGVIIEDKQRLRAILQE